MKRYHRDLGIPEEYKSRLEFLSDKFNKSKRFGRTKHSFHRLNQRFDYASIINFLANKIEFKAEDIFEIYTYNGAVQKVCYRMDYVDNKVLIIVLDKNKNLVTLYLNEKTNTHNRLNKELYATA